MWATNTGERLKPAPDEPAPRLGPGPFLGDDPGVEVRQGRGLQALGPLHGSGLLPGGPEDGVGVTVDVHEARPREQLQQQQEQRDERRPRRHAEAVIHHQQNVETRRRRVFVI